MQFDFPAMALAAQFECLAASDAFAVGHVLRIGLPSILAPQ